MTISAIGQIMRDALYATAVGATGNARAKSNRVPDLEAFQAAVVDARWLQDDGQLTIKREHQESQTAGRFVDHITFVRLA